MDDVDTQTNEAQFREGIRKICNIQFNYDDCTALLQRGLKIQALEDHVKVVVRIFITRYCITK